MLNVGDRPDEQRICRVPFTIMKEMGENFMAATKKISKEGILEAAFNLVRQEGIDSLSARRLAKAIPCSTQPIYENFKDMGVIRDYTLDRMESVYKEVTDKIQDKDNAEYSRFGLDVIEFADRDRKLFRYFVVEDTAVRDEKFLENTHSVDWLIDQYGMTIDAAEAVDREMKYYIMGMALLVNTGKMSLDRTEIVKKIDDYLKYITA